MYFPKYQAHSMLIHVYFFLFYGWCLKTPRIRRDDDNTYNMYIYIRLICVKSSLSSSTLFSLLPTFFFSNVLLAFRHYSFSLLSNTLKYLTYDSTFCGQHMCGSFCTHLLLYLPVVCHSQTNRRNANSTLHGLLML